ncbi:MAG: hypothetical protein ABI898_09505 [Sphingomonadales bacterium]
MRSTVLLLVSGCLVLAGCSKAPNQETANAPEDSAAADTTEHPPGIGATVAPGVAFDFHYGFSLPERQIAAAQEAHAALCGRLGSSHCRVTGVNFDKTRGGAVRANMAFLLDPVMALTFGKDATALVEKADGTLATSQVSGEGVGKSIVAGDKSAEAIRVELAKIDAQLRIPGLSRDVRGRLVEQSGTLRSQLRTLDVERSAKVESLATTPVVFDYEVAQAGVVDSLKQGLNAGTASTSALLNLLAMALGTVGPWAVLAGGAWWGVRRLRRKAVVE